MGQILSVYIIVKIMLNLKGPKKKSFSKSIAIVLLLLLLASGFMYGDTFNLENRDSLPNKIANGASLYVSLRPGLISATVPNEISPDEVDIVVISRQKFYEMYSRLPYNQLVGMENNYRFSDKPLATRGASICFVLQVVSRKKGKEWGLGHFQYTPGEDETAERNVYTSI